MLPNFGSKMMPVGLYIMEDFLRSIWKDFFLFAGSVNALILATSHGN